MASIIAGLVFIGAGAAIFIYMSKRPPMQEEGF
jgi:hypothetical protein